MKPNNENIIKEMFQESLTKVQIPTQVWFYLFFLDYKAF